jgi:hypothetical protein
LSRKSYAIIDSVLLLPSEARRSSFFYHFDDEMRGGTCVPTRERTRALNKPNAQSRVSVWGSIRSSFCSTNKGSSFPTSQATNFTFGLCLFTRVLGCSHQVPGPPFYISYRMKPEIFFATAVGDASWCWTSFESRTQNTCHFMMPWWSYVLCCCIAGVYTYSPETVHKDLPCNNNPRPLHCITLSIKF